MAPISSALRRIRKIRFLKGAAKKVASILDRSLDGLLGSRKGPIRLLVPEKDFPLRQFVRFAGSQAAPRLHIPLLGRKEAERVFARAQAEPYGGGSAGMTWKSRLTEWEAK